MYKCIDLSYLTSFQISPNLTNSSHTQINNELNSIDVHLKQFGLRRQGGIIGDGNCLFRALSLSVFQTQDYHLYLRQTAINYIRDHQADFEPFVMTDSFTDFDHYLSEMSRPGVYGDFTIIVALSHVLDHPISVTQGDMNQVRTISTDPNSVSMSSIHLVYLSENVIPGGHYEVAMNDVHEIGNEVVINQTDKVNETSSPQVVSDNHMVTEVIQSNDAKDRKMFCNLCKMSFQSMSTYNRHNKRRHLANDKVRKIQKQVTCSVPECAFSFRTVNELYLHLEKDHSVCIQSSNIEFSSMVEFRA